MVGGKGDGGFHDERFIQISKGLWLTLALLSSHQFHIDRILILNQRVVSLSCTPLSGKLGEVAVLECLLESSHRSGP
jgi:hypothetical protein